MNARTSRSATAGSGSNDNQHHQNGLEPDLMFDDLLDARFDEQGRLAQVGRGNRQRIAERLDPRPPSTSAEELERAVKKLAEGLEAIERQRRAPARPEPRAARSEPSGRDFVTYSLDRLEARLEALSQRLQSRAAASQARHGETESAPAPQDEPSLAVGPEPAAESIELRRLAEDEEAERAQRQAEAAEQARREAEAAEMARREAEAEAARRAEAEAAEARRMAEEAAEAERRAEREAAEAKSRAEEAEAEAIRQAEAAEQERLERLAEARREAEEAAAMQRQFAEIEARLDSLQKSCDENQIGPVREELIALVQEIEALSHDRGSVTQALDQIGARLSEMETKVNAARNMAGNRLGDIQDRLGDLTERLGEVEVEIPGFDAVRENQGAILERFDRMEGLVHHLASPEQLLDRVEELRRQLQTIASQEEVAQIEERILGLADRIDALPETLSDATALGRIEEQLAAVATELADARDQRTAGTADLERRLDDLSSTLAEVGESGRTPDLSGLEERLAAFGARFDEDRRTSGETLSRLEERLAALVAAIEEQEDDAAAEALAGLTRKIDALAEAIEAQDTSAARREVEALGGKLDQLAAQLAEQAEHLSRAQLQPLEARLDGMQQQLEALAQRAEASSDQLRPFTQKLQELSDRVATLGASDEHTPLSLRLGAIEERIAALSNGHHGRGPDPRALQTQLEGIVSRLELLKGRSIDPARLNELFDRVDAAARALSEDRFDRLEQQLSDATISPERMERLEQRIAQHAAGMSEEDVEQLARRIAESSAAGLSDAEIERLAERVAETARNESENAERRFARLENMLEQIGVAYASDGELLSAGDLAELRSDIGALRRELRSLPGLGAGETNLGDILQNIAARMERLPEDLPATAAELEGQIERIAGLLDDPSHSRLALAHIETSLKSIEERLDETRRSLARPARDAGEAVEEDAEAVADIARSLSDDVTLLRDSAEASEKKNKEALDAVQDTLEAVVKRMAFLERDADAAAERGPADAGAAPVETEPAAKVEPKAARAKQPETAAAVEPPAPEQPAQASAGAPAVEPEIATAAQEKPSKPEAQEPSAPRAGGLLSRFTSRQLLKRATGGRAESFTPEPEESEEETDFPLEPGTDSPLSSALTGAPSSDTELMSGARSKARGGPAVDKDRSVALGATESEVAIDEDFLTAARRAARAAAAEADAAEGSARARGRFAGLKSRRGALMAAALAVAVAFAALQIVRSQMSSGESEIAAAPEPAAPSAPAAGADAASTDGATQPETMQAMAPQMSEKAASGAEAEPTEAAAPAVASATSGETPPVNADEMAALEQVPAGTAAGETPSGGTPSVGAPSVETSLTESIPDEIGSQRLRDAAMAGNSAAAFEVAARFAEGRSGVQDMRTAVAWYERAAEAGLAPAQYRLGSIYEKGLGVPRDLARAQQWYRRAADAGNVKAMHNLAVLYAEGAGGEPDLERAAELFRRAAERGVRDSQFNLAILHARGLGVPEDLAEAYKWFSIAATSGDEESARRRDIIAAALSESDLAKAQAAASAFVPTPLISEANEVLMPQGGWNDAQDATSVEAQPDPEETQVGSVLSENDLVALVQKLLADQGFDPGPTDGLLGRQTIHAIQEFQDHAGLPRTGQIDPLLVEALRDGASS